jgi:hypothetical protein
MMTTKMEPYPTVRLPAREVNRENL